MQMKGAQAACSVEVDRPVIGQVGCQCVDFDSVGGNTQPLIPCCLVAAVSAQHVLAEVPCVTQPVVDSRGNGGGHTPRQPRRRPPAGRNLCEARPPPPSPPPVLRS